MHVATGALVVDTHDFVGVVVRVDVVVVLGVLQVLLVTQVAVEVGLQVGQTRLLCFLLLLVLLHKRNCNAFTLNWPVTSECCHFPTTVVVSVSDGVSRRVNTKV